MTKTLTAVARSKSAAAVARSLRKNNGKRLSSECGWQQRSRPCSLMWLLAVSLAANSLRFTPQHQFKTQTNPRQVIMSGWLCQLIMEAKQKRKCWPQRPTSLECNSRQYDDGALVLSVVASLWIYCTTVHKPREICRDWTVHFMGEQKGCMENNLYPNSKRYVVF